MRHLRAFVYWIGLRPKPGSIFYSPSQAFILAVIKAGKMEQCELCNIWYFTSPRVTILRRKRFAAKICEYCERDSAKGDR